MRTVITLASILALHTATVFAAAEHKATLNGSEAGVSAVAEEVDNTPVTGTIKGGVSRGATVKVNYLKSNALDAKTLAKQASMKIKGDTFSTNKSGPGGRGQAAPTDGQKYQNATKGVNEDGGIRAFLCGNTLRSALTGATARVTVGNLAAATLRGFTFQNSGSNVNVVDARGGAENISVLNFGRGVVGFFGHTLREYYATPAGENPSNGVVAQQLLVSKIENAPIVNGCRQVSVLGGGGGAGGDTEEGGPQGQKAKQGGGAT